MISQTSKSSLSQKAKDIVCSPALIPGLSHKGERGNVTSIGGKRVSNARIYLMVALLAISQPACIVGGGYSSGGGGGWFIWPGGLLGLVLIVALLFFILRRR